MHIENSKQLVIDILEIIDNNGNGYIDYTGKINFNKKFVMAATDAKLLVTKKNLQKIFNMIDLVILIMAEPKWVDFKAGVLVVLRVGPGGK